MKEGRRVEEEWKSVEGSGWRTVVESGDNTNGKLITDYGRTHRWMCVRAEGERERAGEMEGQDERWQETCSNEG